MVKFLILLLIITNVFSVNSFKTVSSYLRIFCKLAESD